MSLNKMNRTPNHPTMRAQRARLVPVAQYATEQAAAWHHFGQLLRAERVTRGKTRGEVLTVMGYSPAHHDYVLSDIEAGLQEVTVGQARQLEQLLGIPAVHLMVQAGLATIAQLDPAGDAMPLAGRRTTVPAAPAPRRSPAARRAEALAVLCTVLGAVLLTAAMVLFVAGHSGWGALVGAAGWIVVSPPLAIITGRVLHTRNRRG